MRSIKINEDINLSTSKVWQLFTELKNYPKYFKYVNKVFYKGEMKLGSNWYDFATFVAPVIVKHKTIVFEAEKSLGFDISLPLGGYVKERINFQSLDNKTKLKGSLEFDFSVFKFLEPLFEKRMKESISGALEKLQEEIKKN